MRLYSGSKGQAAGELVFGCMQVVVLYVEMEESVRRQMLRATMAAQHNKRAADAGSEDIWNVRTTDVDDKKCRRRYEVFRVSKLLYIHTTAQVKQGLEICNITVWYNTL